MAEEPPDPMVLPLTLRVGLDQFGEPFVMISCPPTTLGFGHTITPDTADAVAETIKAAAKMARSRADRYWASLRDGETPGEALRKINLFRPEK